MSKGVHPHPGRDPHAPPTGENQAGALWGIVTVLMTLVGWSSVPLFITYLSGSIDVWTQNGWRYAFAALLWAPVLILAHARRTVPRALWRSALLPSIANALGQTLFTYAYYNIDAATATFGLRMQIVFLAVGAYLMFPSERALLRNPRAWIGILLVLVGVLATIFLRDPSSANPVVKGDVPNPHLGVVAAIAAGFLFAAYALAVRKQMHGYHPVTAFAAVSQVTAGICIALMLAFARSPETGARDLGESALYLPAFPMLMMLISSIIGIALGHVFYFISIARLGVAVTSGVIQVQPFCVAAAQFVVYGIALTSGQWVGGLIAVAGAVLLLHTQWKIGRRRAPTHPPGENFNRETIAGDKPVGIEAAELDAMPINIDGKQRT
ncbi:MAG TPA: DMT family transporter [Phycisphaerales bacterium]|nr:DMT family transporter [Phycisphaerales bacterium]